MAKAKRWKQGRAANKRRNREKKRSRPCASGRERRPSAAHDVVQDACEPPTTLFRQLIFGPLPAQRVHGSVRVRFRARSVNPAAPATWALALRVVSADGDVVRGVLLPLTCGRDRDRFGQGPELHVACPPRLSTVDLLDGDHIVIELGSLGDAEIEFNQEEQNWVRFSDLETGDVAAELQIDRLSREMGRCVYCSRAGPFSREHVVPYGLNGAWTLTHASCEDCRKITSSFEDHVLHAMFGPVRAAVQMQSRSGAEGKTIPLQVTERGVEKTIQLPSEYAPACVAFPVFPPPSPKDPEAGLGLRGVQFGQVAGRLLKDIFRELGYEYAGVRLDFQHMEFARMVAKIAYCFAVLRLGMHWIVEAFVLPAIRGDAHDVGRWVGCETAEPRCTTEGLHALQLVLDEDNVIHVHVRLFAVFDAPEYHVVVGRAKPSFGHG